MARGPYGKCTCVYARAYFASRDRRAFPKSHSSTSNLHTGYAYLEWAVATGNVCAHALHEPLAAPAARVAAAAAADMVMHSPIAAAAARQPPQQEVARLDVAVDDGPAVHVPAKRFAYMSHGQSLRESHRHIHTVT